MASAAADESTSDLVHVGTLTLERQGNRDLDYISLLILYPEMVMVVDYEAEALRLHSLQDGHILATHDRLQSAPQDTCICSKHDNVIQVALCLLRGQIEILDIKSTGQISTITRVMQLDVRAELDFCFGIKYLNDKLLVVGKKQDNMLQYNLCWGIVPITGKYVEQVHKICKCEILSWSYLSTNPHDDNMVYISYWAGDEYPDISGVYGYINSTKDFLYQHKDLVHPTGMTVDRQGFIFVCNIEPDYIYQLTERGQLVTIYRERMPSNIQAIFAEEQQGLLYVAGWNSNIIPIYRLKDTYQQDTAAIPAEIMRMNDQSVQLFKDALKHGEVRVYNIRVMVVGHFGVGKTTMIKRLIGEEVNIRDRQSTEGINVLVHCCKVSRDTLEWTSNEGDSELDFLLQRLARVLKEKQLTRETFADKESTIIIYQKNSNPDSVEDYDKDTKIFHSPKESFGQHLSSTTNEQENSLSTVDEMNLIESETKPVIRSNRERNSNKKDPIRETLQLLRQHADKLKPDEGKYAPLTIWDFGGQYPFYTTHQMFLTRRAIYLLVSDISRQVNDVVDDECYFDSEGIIKCKVYELVDVWLNSIHSCAPSEKGNMNSTSHYKVVPPPVILVGTHVDQVTQGDRHMVCERYFDEIRSHLSDKPSRFHLVDEDFSIDNTIVDSTLDDLKRKIVEVASQQVYWGEKRPAHWLPLEQALMKFKAEGIKVIALSMMEDLNQTAAIQMSAEELDLFLRFLHDIGSIIYFSMEVLKDNIVLDPQWMIDALKSLITAKMFILRSTQAISDKWFEFEKNGKLSMKLIDAVWTQKKNVDFHINKEHILMLMEHLNIIAKPRLYQNDVLEIEEEKYFLAPCMLRQKAPKEVISPEFHPQKDSSSVLCCVFTEKYLPSSIFHRLMASCVAHWQLATKKKENTVENMIYCGCGVFQLDQYHQLILHFRHYVIFVKVTKMGIKDKTLSSKLCIEVREFITATLRRIIGCLEQSLQFEYYIQCPEYNGVSVNSLIPVSFLKENSEVRCDFHSNIIESHRMLQFWFDDQEQSGDSDACDTDRFMRIAYLLVDVGSQVLRHLLHHHTISPTVTFNQYLVNNKNIINRLLKKKVLNISQMDILFPPNGGSTNIEEYDITLLSVLVNNIVPSISQPVKSMIVDLRNERNKVYGHAKSCKMSAKEYQTHYKSISATLISLSQQCGNSNFENKILMEIRHIPYLAIPAGSYVDTLKTWFNRIETVEESLETFGSALQVLTSRVDALELNNSTDEGDGSK